MKSRIVQAAVVCAVGLGALVVLGAVLHWTWLVALAGAFLGAAVLGLVADTNRRVRRLERRFEKRRDSAPDEPVTVPPVTPADVLGTVRLLQAQYTGRLDRLQGTVERLVATHEGADHTDS